MKNEEKYIASVISNLVDLAQIFNQHMLKICFPVRMK